MFPIAVYNGALLVRDFLADAGMTAGQVDRVAYLVAHHHTYSGVDGADYQILLEADYIANACENGYSRENVENFARTVLRTAGGRRILRAVFGV